MAVGIEAKAEVSSRARGSVEIIPQSGEVGRSKIVNEIKIPRRAAIRIAESGQVTALSAEIILEYVIGGVVTDRNNAFGGVVEEMNVELVVLLLPIVDIFNRQSGSGDLLARWNGPTYAPCRRLVMIQVTQVRRGRAESDCARRNRPHQSRNC